MPHLFATLFFLLCTTGAFAQPMYEMQNLTVDDCEGFITDSEAGDVPGTYDHNENFTFSICVPEAESITLTFLEFCTETDFDSLRIYDGPDTLSLLLGTFTGEPDPPVLVATSGCLTLNFVSDPSVTCTGWNARWQADFTPPEPPEILPIDPLDCFADTLRVTFDRPLPCDSLHAAAFGIFGPQSPGITAVDVLDCVDGEATSVLLHYAPPIDFSGSYQVFHTYRPRVCETVYELTSVGNFVVVNCPLQVRLETVGDLPCAGDSVTLAALASGGDLNTYAYTWAPPQADTDTITNILWGATWFSVTVTDAQGGFATDSLLVEPAARPAFSIPDTTLCQSDSAFQITAFPPEGEWFGVGIVHRSSGWYEPGLVEAENVLTDTITYIAPNDCENQLILDFLPLDQGTDDAVCPGVDSFRVSGGVPVGGGWSGAFIDTAGWFSVPADTTGSFLVTYTHPNGCAGDKLVTLDTLVFPDIDTLCASDTAFLIPVRPYGGVWSGPGIVDADTGEFDPREANAGDNVLTYEAEGCSGTMTIFVREIYAGRNRSVCPEQSPFILSEFEPNDGSGVWSGLGIVDSVGGWYDPGLIPNGARDTLTFTVEGCTDTRIIVSRRTEVRLDTVPQFCPGDEPYDLRRQNTRTRPNVGVWTGPGVLNPDDEEFFFDPGAVATGLYTLTYTMNECSDSLVVEVHPTPEIPTVEFCENEVPQPLAAIPAGGQWSGTGITNPFTGVFDPGAAAAGNFVVTNVSTDGCPGQGVVDVLPYFEAQVGMEPEPFYCHSSDPLNLQLTPGFGTLSVNGDTLAALTFGPADFGEGTHEFTFGVGEGACHNELSRVFSVGAPLLVNIADAPDTLCGGASVNLFAQAAGGSSSGNYTYVWNQNLGFGQSQQFVPAQSGAYVVTAEDGCSDAARDTLVLVVQNAFSADFITGEPVCFEDTTFAEILITPPGNYTIEWSNGFVGDYLESYPTSFDVTVTDQETNCTEYLFVDLPGYPLIQANFSISPADECISSLDPEVQLLDFSTGGATGVWDFGDGTTEPYILGQQPTHRYPDTGTYEVTLRIRNVGYCWSEHTETLCIRAEHRLYAPNVFTPNGDGLNDFFLFKGTNVEEVEWTIFNRYGEVVFEGESLLDRWDGHFRGQPVPSGTFTYFARYQTRDTGARTMRGTVLVMY